MTKQLTQEHIDHNTKLLVQASEKGCLENVKKLLPVSNPKAQNSQALRWAAINGHTEIVKLLIPVSNPKANSSRALRLAAEEEHIECMKLLIPVSDYQIVMHKMQKSYNNITILQQCIDEYEVLQQKEHLTHQLNNSTQNKHCSPKRKI